MNIAEQSAVELGKKIASKELTSQQVTEEFLNRVDQSEDRVRAFTNRDESALETAKRIDSRIASGEKLAALAGR